MLEIDGRDREGGMPTLPQEWTVPGRIVTGRGCAETLLEEAAAFGPRGMLVHGASLERSGALARLRAAAPAGIALRTWRHPGGEPTLEQLEVLRETARAARPDWIAAVGGGSVMDIAKAAAGLLDAPLPAEAYHDGAALPAGRVPFLAVPTTAGTGSETTRVSVLTNARTGVKKSIRHRTHMARTVLLDAALLVSCPPPVMGASGMDALTQAVEAYCSRHATWMSDAWALKAAADIAANLEPACRGATGACLDALLTGSALAGLALSHARLGVVHGLAHPLGTRYGAPHGLACAFCLPAALRFNRAAIGAKYARLETALGGDPVARTEALLRALGLHDPFGGRALDDADGIIAETLASGSTRANPRTVDADGVRWFLDRLFGDGDAA
jgi:alcohol dehydrogenase class IV